MEIVLVIAGIAVGVMLAELLLPTGGVLALIGAAGLVAAGVVAIENDANDGLGAGLITVGVISIAVAWIVGRKVLSAHRDEPVRTGWEELLGREAEVRDPLDPEGQVWIEGALWKARVEDGAARITPGNRVLIERLDGLTLVVRPLATSMKTTQSEAKE
jgi:membrane-bound serine protease (ClpP class)